MVTLLALAPARSEAQETAVRFPVTEVGDTTFAFRLGDHQWVRPGLRGIVVDPRQQDVLVARFRIYGVSQGQARAVITGQTTTLSTQHMVLLDVPQVPWYRQRSFWIGTAAGAVVGFLLGKI
jgi:hypothetical protein